MPTVSDSVNTSKTLWHSLGPKEYTRSVWFLCSSITLFSWSRWKTNCISTSTLWNETLTARQHLQNSQCTASKHADENGLFVEFSATDASIHYGNWTNVMGVEWGPSQQMASQIVCGVCVVCVCICMCVVRVCMCACMHVCMCKQPCVSSYSVRLVFWYVFTESFLFPCFNHIEHYASAHSLEALHNYSVLQIQQNIAHDSKYLRIKFMLILEN